MRRSKTIVVAGESFVVNEMRVVDIMRLQHDTPHLLVGMAIGDPDAIAQAIRLCVEQSAELDSAMEYVNGYALLEQAWREVNSDFLDVLPARLDVLKSMTKALGVSLTGAIS